LRFIYQELTLVKDIDIARNMFLGMEPMRTGMPGVIDQARLYSQAGALLRQFHTANARSTA
jgi:ABC-type sugar transport system ATPase subunit